MPADRGPDVDAVLDAAAQLEPGQGPALAEVVARELGAHASRVLVADYALRRLQQVGHQGPIGPPQLIVGTIAGRAFTSGHVIASGNQPTVVSIPLADGTDRIGLLELEYDTWSGDLPTGWERVVAILVLVLITTLERLPVAETARRLSEHVTDHVASHLNDDATLFLIEYSVHEPQVG